MKDLNEMFLHFLQDMYYAERQVLKTLPKLAKAAQNKDLKDMLAQSREEKPQAIEQMQHVFELVGKRARGVTCEAMSGLIEEAQELLEEATEPSPTRDAGLIACAQGMAHYGMARYGTMAAWAKAIGNDKAAQVLQQMLDGNESADQHLNELANVTLNPQAARGENGDETKPASSSKKSGRSKKEAA